MRRDAMVATFGYHEVSNDPTSSGLQRPGARPFTLPEPMFARHLEAIARGPCTPEHFHEIDPARPGRHLLMTFDDGGKSALHAAEALGRHGWKGHFFIITGRIGDAGFLDVGEIRQLRQCGHVIGSHSVTHPSLFRELSDERMREEWRTSADRLAQLLGEPCVAASVPGGDISARVLRSADEVGLRCLFTSEPTLTPQRVGRCWVLGRFVPKIHTPPSRVGELAQFRGWGRAMLVRRLKVGARVLLPGLYRRYVRQRTTPFHEEPLPRTLARNS